MSITRKITKKMKNKVLAMAAAAPAIPQKPNNPATMATTKNIKAHLSMKKR